jgi:hypothetical protein
LRQGSRGSVFDAITIGFRLLCFVFVGSGDGRFLLVFVGELSAGVFVGALLALLTTCSLLEGVCEAFLAQGLEAEV